MKLPFLSGLVAGVVLVAAGPPAGGQPPKKGSFTVGKETTYVTGPLEKDGRIDYAAALNERLAKGVTPQNNANVLIWQALGPRPEGGSGMPPEFFRLLGIPEPPLKGDYFIGLNQFARERLKTEPGQPLYDQQSRAMQYPWTAKENPEIAGWLKANEKPLAVIVEATKRTHYYMPLLPTRDAKGASSGLIGALLPSVQKCREATSALTARAMLKLGQGAADDAWQDLIACHRLGRLVGRGGTLIEGLVGIAIDAIAIRTDLVFLDRGKLDAKRLDACLRDLQALPPLPDVAEKIDLTERFMFLDAVMQLDRQGVNYLGALSGVTGQPNPLPGVAFKGIDWDPVLRDANDKYDRLTATLRKETRAERQKELARIDMEIRAIKAKAPGGKDLTRAAVEKLTGKELGQAVGNILFGLLMPAADKVQDAVDRAYQHQDNLAVALALARYRVDNKQYPKDLAALTPKYLTEVPGDAFSGKGLVYRPAGDGYLLYSVGVNGRDEGGRGPEEQPPGDDLAVRMPVPPTRKK
jgi:hypothetical protein